MYKDFFIRSPLLTLPIIALVLFLTVFVSVLVRVLRRPAQQFDSEARMPLGNDQEDSREH